MGFIWGLFLRKLRKSYEMIRKATEQEWLVYADLQHITKRQNKQKFQFVMRRSRVRVPLPVPRRNKFLLFRFFTLQKISHPFHCSSSFTKRHVRVGYSLVNALITPLALYHLFVATRRTECGKFCRA